MAKTQSQVLRLFWRHPGEDPLSIRGKLNDLRKGPYLYFRRIKTPIQARFAELFDHTNIPQVFLHGSPHIDNYAKTLTGYGIIDFDRAHFGPYSWDIICLLLSLSLREENSLIHFVKKEISQVLEEGYLQGFQFPEEGYKQYAPLAHVQPKEWEKTTLAYLKANKKWAKKLHQHSLNINDPVAQEVLHQYLLNRDELSVLKHFSVNDVAYCAGTFGRPRFLISLMPHATTKQDAILLDIKQTRDYNNPAWPHNRWYHHPFDHQGKRMIAASNLYAPKCTMGEGYATVNGIEYWGRHVPTMNYKPAKLISLDQQRDFAFAAATQIGRGHRLSLQQISHKNFIKHFYDNYHQFVKITQHIHQELMSTWKVYVEQFRKK